MTNKQERYFVVSEAELKELVGASAIFEICEPDEAEACFEAWQKAEAACRARPVPEWATHFTGVVVAKWNGGDAEGVDTRHEEIKK